MITTSENDANAYFTFSWEVVLKIKNYNLNETPGWNWLCLVYVEWLLRTMCMVDLTVHVGVFT